MKVYLALGDEDVVNGVFSTKEGALETFPDACIAERDVHSSALPPWKYWHRGAHVYPDGTYEEWTRERTEQGEVGISPCDDHLNARDEPWDGHTQGHCGEHISIVGTDKDAVESAFQRHLKKAVARQNGCCQTKWRHGNRIAGVDGVSIYDSGFMKPPRLAARGPRDQAAG